MSRQARAYGVLGLIAEAMNAVVFARNYVSLTELGTQDSSLGVPRRLIKTGVITQR
jgi:hypothetical protein